MRDVKNNFEAVSFSSEVRRAGRVVAGLREERRVCLRSNEAHIYLYEETVAIQFLKSTCR